MKKSLLFLLCGLLAVESAYAQQSVGIAASANPVCAATAVTFTATPANAPSPTYRWTRNSATISGATATTYISSNLANNDTIRCLMTSGGTTVSSNAIVMTVKTPPAAFNLTVNKATTFCQGGSVTLSPNTTAANLSGFPNYQWSNNGAAISGATSLSYAATASGSYTITVSDNMGCGRTSVARPVTVNPLPAAAISTAQNPICAGNTAVLSASPSGTYSWMVGGKTITGATAATYTTGTAGSYTVAVTDANGCVGTSPALALSVTTPPAAFNLTANKATTFCAGGSVTLSPNAKANLTGFPNYQWSNNGAAIQLATSASYMATASGSYTLSVSDGNGCGRTSVARPVTVNTTVASVTPTNPAAVCQGNNVLLTAAAVPGNTYQWRYNNTNISGATSSTYQATTSGNYSVVVTNSGCPATSNVVAVTVNPAPDVTITPSGSTSLCTGGSVTLSVPAGADAYQWYEGNAAISGEMNASYTATADGSYTVNATNSFGCSATSNATSVTVNPLPDATISASSPTTFCDGDYASLSVPSIAYTYQWYKDGMPITDATADSYNATTAGDYTVRATTALGCSDSSAVPVTITVNPSPDVTITTNGPTTFCAGNSVTLSVPYGADFYEWTRDGSTVYWDWQPDFTADASGAYAVTAYGSNGCSATSMPVNITVSDYPEAYITNLSSQNLCGAGASVSFVANTGEGLTYQWYDGEGMPITGATGDTFTATGAGYYSVQVTNAAGCSNYSNGMEVTAACPPVITLVNTPNVCAGNNITVSYTATGFGEYNSFYLYMTNDTTSLYGDMYLGQVGANGDGTVEGNIPWDASGQYWLRLVSTYPGTEGYYYPVPLTVTGQIYNYVSLCAVTVDSMSGSNLLTWNAPESNSIDSFKFYRRDSLGEWQSVRAQAYDSAGVRTWTDADSKPETRAYAYYMTAMNACAETIPNQWHQTIHLSINKGTNDSTWNLIWNGYSGVYLNYYNIYRGTSPANMALLTTIDANYYNSFTDPAAPAGENYYMVAVGDAIDCDNAPQKSTSQHKSASGNGLKIASNIASTQTGQKGPAANWVAMKLYPNPSSAAGTLLIQSSTVGETFTVRIVDITGRLVDAPQTATAGQELSFGAALAPGLYTVEVSNGSDKRMIQKWIKQ